MVDSDAKSDSKDLRIHAAFELHTLAFKLQLQALRLATLRAVAACRAFENAMKQPEDL